MFEKNLKYYRLKNKMTRKALAEAIGVTPMAISNYESGKRRPSMDTIKLLAEVLHVTITDFLACNDTGLQFSHGKFKKSTTLGLMDQEYILESVEEYFSRFFQVVSILGGQDILAQSPKSGLIPWNDNIDEAASQLRKYLGIPKYGPINNLVEILENNGILVFFIDYESDDFAGLNGTVNEIPYIVINSNMSPLKIRYTIVHEVAHFAFNWPDNLSEVEEEQNVNDISGAFLFTREDAIRELGIKRSCISKAMTITCVEYGIGIYMLTRRARLNEIINDSAEKDFYSKASKMGWRNNEPDWGIQKETPNLFKQLVYRAVTEEEISVQKGAELLQTSYESVLQNCYF